MSVADMLYESETVIKLCSVVPNSMSKERTMSDVTLVNSALHNRQGVQTQVDQVQIR
jgi:hypothetical protein